MNLCRRPSETQRKISQIGQSLTLPTRISVTLITSLRTHRFAGSSFGPCHRDRRQFDLDGYLAGFQLQGLGKAVGNKATDSCYDWARLSLSKAGDKALRVKNDIEFGIDQI